jgi:hypothetical protein
MADGKQCRGGDSWVLFSCDTALHAGQDIRRTQSRKCEGLERARLVDRIVRLEAEAKQAREDEEWGIANDSDVMSGHGQWTAQYWVDPLTGWISAEAPTIHAALRALRAKVEGGTR